MHTRPYTNRENCENRYRSLYRNRGNRYRSLYQNRENRYPSGWHVPVPKICIVAPPPPGLNADTWKKINSFEIWMYRRMLTISYTSHTTNEKVLKRVNGKGLSLEKNIKMRKTQYFGHSVRKGKMQKSLLEGKVCAKRPRGLPCKSWITESWNGQS